MKNLEECPICQREVNQYDMTIHHWKPKCNGGTHQDTMRICRTCHDTLHYVIPIEQVEQFSSPKKLESHWIYGLYIRWIRNKEHSSMYKVKKARSQWLPKKLWDFRKNRAS